MECTLYPSPTNTKTTPDGAYYVLHFSYSHLPLSPYHNLCTYTRFVLICDYKKKSSVAKGPSSVRRMVLRNWRGFRNVKIRSPAGAERQGDPSCSTRAGLGQSKTWRRGCRNCGRQSLRTASGRSAAIPEAAVHLSGKQRSELLMTGSNWTIFSHLSAKQLHQLRWHICAKRESIGQRKFCTHFSHLNLSPLFLPPLNLSLHPVLLGIFLASISLGDMAWAASSLRGNGAFGIWQSRFLWHILGLGTAGAPYWEL